MPLETSVKKSLYLVVAGLFTSQEYPVLKQDLFNSQLTGSVCTVSNVISIVVSSTFLKKPSTT